MVVKGGSFIMVKEEFTTLFFLLGALKVLVDTSELRLGSFWKHFLGVWDHVKRAGNCLDMPGAISMYNVGQLRLYLTQVGGAVYKIELFI